MKNTRISQKNSPSAAAVLVIIVIIAVNVLSGFIASKTDFTIDITQDKVLQFSPLTEEVIKNLKEDVNIISIVPESVNYSYGVMSSLRTKKIRHRVGQDKIHRR